nr:MAG TPA: hypothetical protein [Bacteriophage sp.]
MERARGKFLLALNFYFGKINFFLFYRIILPTTPNVSLKCFV